MRLEAYEKVNGMNIANIMGCGNQKGNLRSTRQYEFSVNLLPKIKVETVVTDEQAPAIVDEVVKEIQTGNFGDGKIFIYDVEEADRIRNSLPDRNTQESAS